MFRPRRAVALVTRRTGLLFPLSDGWELSGEPAPVPAAAPGVVSGRSFPLWLDVFMRSPRFFVSCSSFCERSQACTGIPPFHTRNGACTACSKAFTGILRSRHRNCLFRSECHDDRSGLTGLSLRRKTGRSTRKSQHGTGDGSVHSTTLRHRAGAPMSRYRSIAVSGRCGAGDTKT